MRLKGGTMDLGIRAFYSPPFGGSSGARRKVQMTGLDENSSFELAQQSFHDRSW